MQEKVSEPAEVTEQPAKTCLDIWLAAMLAPQLPIWEFLAVSHPPRGPESVQTMTSKNEVLP